MARPPRIDFPGARHHVMNRASRRENIFLDPDACALFLSLLAELATRFRVRILAYAIMPNHYHLLLECPEGNLSLAMKFLGGQFTQRLNRKNGWDGPIFRGRFTSRLVTTDGYLAYLYAYIHLNPVRAGLAASVDEAVLTSHRALLGLERPPPWLDGAGLLESFGTLEACTDYVAAIERGEVELPDEWVRLWSRTPPSNVPPKRSTPDIAASIAAIARTAGVPATDVLKPDQPREVRRFAAWALTQRVSNVEAARLLGCRPGRVSQLRAAAARMGGWVAQWRTQVWSDPAPPLLAHEGPAATYRNGGIPYRAIHTRTRPLQDAWRRPAWSAQPWTPDDTRASSRSTNAPAAWASSRSGR